MFGQNRASYREKIVDRRATRKGYTTHKAKDGTVFLKGVEAVDAKGNKLGHEVVISKKDPVPDGYHPDKDPTITNHQRVVQQRYRSGRITKKKG